MKKTEELKPNYAPVYAAALYPDLAKLFHKAGYALAAHGSLARDFDLIAIPWSENIINFDLVIERITKEFAIRVIGEPQRMSYGRYAYTLSIGHGECAIDLSFFPNVFKLK